MLSRGIDPDVADPSKCHSHPEVPTRWPSHRELQARRFSCRRTRDSHHENLATSELSISVVVVFCAFFVLHLALLTS